MANATTSFLPGSQVFVARSKTATKFRGSLGCIYGEVPGNPEMLYVCQFVNSMPIPVAKSRLTLIPRNL